MTVCGAIRSLNSSTSCRVKPLKCVYITSAFTITCHIVSSTNDLTKQFMFLEVNNRGLGLLDLEITLI